MGDFLPGLATLSRTLSSIAVSRASVMILLLFPRQVGPLLGPPSPAPHPPLPACRLHHCDYSVLATVIVPGLASHYRNKVTINGGPAALLCSPLRKCIPVINMKIHIHIFIL